MTDCAMCPSCGYNFEEDRPMGTGEWHIDPRTGVFYGGKLVAKRSTWANILLALMRANGRAVRGEALLNRVSDKENRNVLASQISQLRRHLTEQGAPDPIRRAGKGEGYRWADPALELL